MATELDPASDRIIEFLAESYDVPINAVFFGHFADGGLAYLARTWLLDPQHVEDKAARPSRRKLRPCNGRDFYVILGRAEPGDPRWPIAHKYGFGNAGGGPWYWKPLRNLEPGHRVFAYVSGAGYVGIGRITGKVIPPILGESGYFVSRGGNGSGAEPAETITLKISKIIKETKLIKLANG